MAATEQLMLAEGSLREYLLTVRELTVREVRDYLTAAEAGVPVDALHELVMTDCGMADLAIMCADTSVRDLEAFTPSELAPAVAAAKRLNPHFFRVRAAMTLVARRMLTEGMPQNESSATSAPLFGEATPTPGITPGASS